MSNCAIRFFFFFEPLGGSLPDNWNRTTPSTSENSVLWLVQIPNALKHEKYTDNRLLNSIALQQKQLISEGKEKTAFEILEEAIICKDLDWPTRINAAKAMLPYQEK
jgi:hypothetical protein